MVVAWPRVRGILVVMVRVLIPRASQLTGKQANADGKVCQVGVEKAAALIKMR